MGWDFFCRMMRHKSCQSKLSKNCFLIKNFSPHKDILRTQVTAALIQKVGGLLCVGSEKVIALVLQYLG